MTLERRKRLTLSCLILCAMLVCVPFSWSRHLPHHFAFQLTFWILLGINSCLNYKYASERRMPDTLIHLFPESPATPKERP